MNKFMIMLMFAPEGGDGGAGGTPSPAPSPDPAPAAPAAPATTGGPDPAEGPKPPITIDPRNDDPADPPAPELPKYFSQFDPTKRETEEYKAIGAKHKSLTDLADDYIATNNRLSKALELPGKDATHEEMQAFLQKLGVPENEEGYELKSDGIEGDESAELFKGAMAKQFMRNGMTKKQANGVWDTISKLYQEGNAYTQNERANKAQTFDARMASQLEDAYPVEADRNGAMQEASTLFKQHMQRTGLGKTYKESGLIYDPSFVLAIANDEKARSGNAIIGGKTGTSGDKPIGAFGNGYSDDFKDTLKR